jgi:hypothetical protein
LNQYETLLKSHGLTPEAGDALEEESNVNDAYIPSESFQAMNVNDSPTGSSTRSTNADLVPPETGKLYTDKGKSTFVEK